MVPETFPLEILKDSPPEAFPSLVGAIPLVVIAPALTAFGASAVPLSLHTPAFFPEASRLLAVNLFHNGLRRFNSKRDSFSISIGRAFKFFIINSF